MLAEPNRLLWNFYPWPSYFTMILRLQILTFKVKFKDDSISNYTVEVRVTGKPLSLCCYRVIYPEAIFVDLKLLHHRQPKLKYYPMARMSPHFPQDLGHHKSKPPHFPHYSGWNLLQSSHKVPVPPQVTRGPAPLHLGKPMRSALQPGLRSLPTRPG